jgi:metal-responsive CopG/Arc/MetJ family transcriptional regulator
MKVPVHVTLPYSLLKELDTETKNRSRFIAKAVRARLDGGSGATIEDATTRQLMAALAQREDVDRTLSQLLLVMLKEANASKQS